MSPQQSSKTEKEKNSSCHHRSDYYMNLLSCKLVIKGTEHHDFSGGSVVHAFLMRESSFLPKADSKG